MWKLILFTSYLPDFVYCIVRSAKNSYFFIEVCPSKSFTGQSAYDYTWSMVFQTYIGKIKTIRSAKGAEVQPQEGWSVWIGQFI